MCSKQDGVGAAAASFLSLFGLPLTSLAFRQGTGCGGVAIFFRTAVEWNDLASVWRSIGQR